MTTTLNAVQLVCRKIRCYKLAFVIWLSISRLTNCHVFFPLHFYNGGKFNYSVHFLHLLEWTHFILSNPHWLSTVCKWFLTVSQSKKEWKNEKNATKPKLPFNWNTIICHRSDPCDRNEKKHSNQKLAISTHRKINITFILYFIWYFFCSFVSSLFASEISLIICKLFTTDFLCDFFLIHCSFSLSVCLGFELPLALVTLVHHHIQSR